jgi:hypothetical protein
MSPEDIQEATAQIRSNAGLPDAEYLEASLDKESLMSLADKLNIKDK